MNEQKNLIKKKSQGRETWDRFIRNRGAVVGLVIIIIVVLAALLSGFIYDYEEDVVKLDSPNRLQWPNSKNLLGTDEFGRDLLARIVWGSKYSLSISFAAVVGALLGGGVIGALAGYYGGILDNVLMRIMDIIMAMPMILWAMIIVSVLGSSTINLITALGIAMIPTFARTVRGAVLTVRDQDYIEATKALGAKDSTIVISHILPNCMAPIIVQATLRIAATITSTAALSFLGLGIQQPMPEWGALLSSGRTFIRDSSYLTLFPGLAIMVTILALNLLGDGLRDALDPRLK